jgi:hypothetical protein
LPKAGRRAGGCGRKFIDLKRTWLPKVVELLLDDEVVESMLPALKLPTGGAN